MRKFGDANAVSRTLSVLLLVIVTFVVGILVHSVVSGMMGNLAKPASTQHFSLIVNNVVINNTCITVYVRNTFNQDVTVVGAYVNNEPRNVLVTTFNVAIIPKNPTGKVQIPDSYTAGSLYDIRIVCSSEFTLSALERY